MNKENRPVIVKAFLADAVYRPAIALPVYTGSAPLRARQQFHRLHPVILARRDGANSHPIEDIRRRRQRQLTGNNLLPRQSRWVSLRRQGRETVTCQFIRHRMFQPTALTRRAFRRCQNTTTTEREPDDLFTAGRFPGALRIPTLPQRAGAADRNHI